MTRLKQKSNPWKKILSNAMGAQNGWNAWHQSKGVNRPVKKFSITPEDIEKIFNDQEQKSKWLKIPINPDDVFKKHYPMAPSLDRLDNSKDYTIDNVCISTRFENLGFNRCTDEVKIECINIINNKLTND